MNKRVHKYLVFVSILFLLGGLYKADFVRVPTILSYPDLSLSFAFLIFGFLTNAYSWKAVLKQTRYSAPANVCIAGYGLSIFTQYIPGKVLVIMGRAAYVAEFLRYPIVKLSALSLNAQIIALWAGFSLGALGAFLVGGFLVGKWLVLVLWIILSLSIFSPFAHQLLEKTIQIILRKKVSLPQLEWRSVIRVIPWFLGFWLCWSVGFYFFIKGFYDIDANYAIGLCFPLVTTLGIMAIVVPGGIGVREGLMVGYFSLAGFELQDAAGISIAARFWFMFGEFSIFVVGWIAHRSVRKINATVMD